jgi:hypothetical protein
MILILVRVLLVPTDGGGGPKEFVDQAIRLQGFGVQLPLKVELRDLLLDLRQVLVRQRECDAASLHFYDLLLYQGVFEDFVLFAVLLVMLPHGELVPVQGVVLRHLGHMHVQVEGAWS